MLLRSWKHHFGFGEVFYHVSAKSVRTLLVEIRASGNPAFVIILDIFLDILLDILLDFLLEILLDILLDIILDIILDLILDFIVDIIVDIFLDIIIRGGPVYSAASFAL